MKPILIVNPELGWDNVSYILDGTNISDEQMEKLEEICDNNGYILIDWRRVSSVESFLQEHD